MNTDNDNLHLDERLSATHQFGSKKHTLSADLRYQWGDQRQEFAEEEALGAIRERGIDDQLDITLAILAACSPTKPRRCLNSEGRSAEPAPLTHLRHHRVRPIY